MKKLITFIKLAGVFILTSNSNPSISKEIAIHVWPMTTNWMGLPDIGSLTGWREEKKSPLGHVALKVGDRYLSLYPKKPMGPYETALR
jgi:hypothetical protein